MDNKVFQNKSEENHALERRHVHSFPGLKIRGDLYLTMGTWS